MNMNQKEKIGVQVQSVARAAEILRCFQYTPEMGISEIAAEMQLSKSTVFGLVNTLLQYGYLEQEKSNKKYRLGWTLFEMGQLVVDRADIQTEAKKLCEPLSQKYPATVHTAIYVGGEVIYTSKVGAVSSLITSSNVGKRAPIYCTGIGKAMLAYLPEEYMDRYLHFPLKKVTENTITTREALLENLEEVRRIGIAIDREEIEEGLVCVAAPVLRQDGTPLLAISFAFPYGRIQNVDIEELRRDLLGCTRKLSAQLGYRE